MAERCPSTGLKYPFGNLDQPPSPSCLGLKPPAIAPPGQIPALSPPQSHWSVCPDSDAENIRDPWRWCGGHWPARSAIREASFPADQALRLRSAFVQYGVAPLANRRFREACALLLPRPHARGGLDCD